MKKSFIIYTFIIFILTSFSIFAEREVSYENLGYYEENELVYVIDEKEPFDKEIEKLKEKNSNDLNLNELISSYYFGNELVQNARNQMVDKLEYLIYYIINKRFSTFKKYTKELYQEGIVGVLASLPKYDYHKASPSTYFFNYILHQMTDFVNYQINKTSPHYATHITKIKKAINAFEKEGREVTVKDLAQETGISVETIVQSMNIMEKANYSMTI